ncbi:MAG: hypothetical protein IJW59_04195 [Clostridia bacterium]|nr:hypothetical protein [Clostridia bacterium]
MRDFEKISFEQFKKDVKDDEDLYKAYQLPSRGSSSTAGYDIFLLEDLEIAPNEIKKLPTGLKARFEEDEVLFLIVRSGTGFKYNIRLCNQVAVIDADYYNNKNNEGHMWIKIQNESEKTVSIPRGEAVVQGVFMKYLTTDSDNNLHKERVGKY